MTTIATPRFSTAIITATPEALDILEAAHISPASLLARHFAGEWGGDADNGQVNERYLGQGYGMLLSIFDIAGEKIWAISHIGGPDAYTCLLLPSQY